MIRARAAPDDLLPDRLTDPRRRAVTHTGGPLLVVAGPGAGKTSVMVRRAAWLVLEHGVDPGGLLITTFTDEAAEEYRVVAEACGRCRELLSEEGLLDFSTPQSVSWGILYDEELHESSGEGDEGAGSGAGEPGGSQDVAGPTLLLDGRDPERADARREARRELRRRENLLQVRGWRGWMCGWRVGVLCVWAVSHLAMNTQMRADVAGPLSGLHVGNINMLS